MTVLAAIGPADRALTFPGPWLWAAGALLVWALVLAIRRRFRFSDVELVLRIQPTHFLPAGIQIVLFGYWALYWTEVGEHLPVVLAQLGYAYALDALLGITLYRRWVLGYAPMPVVLSANLFVWFPVAQSWIAILVITVALGAKAFVLRGGRHIFNPSAIGIAVAAVLWLALPEVFPHVDIAHELNLPPNMLELMFLLALIPQFLVPVSLISASGLVIMVVLVAAIPGFRPGPFWPPVFLALLLLATDPATMPRSGLGRVLFGLFIGAGIVLLSTLFEATGRSDFYAKVLPIPAANFLVPWFDRVAESLPARLHALTDPRHNLRHVFAFAAIVVILTLPGGHKEGAFEGRFHEVYSTPLVALDDEGHAACEHNPVFCSPFSFLSEVRGWWSRPPVAARDLEP